MNALLAKNLKVKNLITWSWTTRSSEISFEFWLCFSNTQKQSPRGVLGKGVLKICSKFTGEHLCRSAISIKLQSNWRNPKWKTSFFVQQCMQHRELTVRSNYIQSRTSNSISYKYNSSATTKKVNLIWNLKLKLLSSATLLKSHFGMRVLL